MLSNVEVLKLNLSSKFIVLIVKLLEAAFVSEVLDLLVGADKDLSLSHGQVESEVAVGSQEVVLDSLVQEPGRLTLHLVQVIQLQLTHGETSRHPQLPFDFVCKNN